MHLLAPGSENVPSLQVVSLPGWHALPAGQGVHVLAVAPRKPFLGHWKTSTPFVTYPLAGALHELLLAAEYVPDGQGSIAPLLHL